MSELVSAVATAWQATSALEVISVAFGLIYIILAAREKIWCWPAAFIGTGTAVYLFWDASLLMESALNIFYLAMAIIGWWQWQYGSEQKTALAISSWSGVKHLTAIGVIALLTLTSGYLLSYNTSAALPYVDSFTTWAAVVTTIMVARKVLENWLYWIVIDAVSVWLYSERGLYLYALLFAAYTVIAVVGYVQWRKKFVYQ